MAKTTTKVKATTEPIVMALTFKQKLANKIADAQVEQDKKQEIAMNKLLDNDNFIEIQRTVNAKEEELASLTETISQLNSITPYIAMDGRKFSINVFPIAIFGTGHAQIIGMIAGSRGAFIDEKMMEYAAISGITTLELTEAQAALGSPAYYKDGKINDAVPGDFGTLKMLLEGIYLKLDMHEFKADDITRAKYDLYYSVAEAKTLKQLTEHDALQDLEAGAEDFVLED